MITSSEKDKVVAQFKEYLKANNMRCTPTRLRILELCTIINPPIFFKDLLERCQKEDISMQTLYDTIKVLLEAKVIKRITLQGKSKVAYALVSDSRNKAKIICTRCGREEEFKDITVKEHLLTHRYGNFNFNYFTITVYGECKVCRKLLGETIINGWTDNDDR